ncbi:MAG TPA: hypothetical protein VN228_12580 [Pyrinomonadaceae bacterium]|nr:hypothetical protein [Pyrinomonadaceae bacterium]
MNGVRLDPLKEAVARRLLTLVLLTVLVWHTVVLPAPAGAFVRRAGGPRDAEEREEGGPREAAAERDAPVEDLDWPEFING